MKIGICVMGKDVAQYVEEIKTIIDEKLWHVPCIGPIGYCLREGIDHCVFVGPFDEKNRVITIKRISDRVQVVIPLADSERLCQWLGN
jgi:hypothetical protein